MSNFGVKLAELLEKNRIRAADLSRMSKLSDALISKWINGGQRFVSTEDLATVCSHISSTARDRAELIRARLLDELGAPGSELIAITIRGSEPVPLPERQVLPRHIQQALDLVGHQALLDADVRAVLLGLAGILDASSGPAGPAVQAAEAAAVAAAKMEVLKKKRPAK